jgi:hypothetical protein
MFKITAVVLLLLLSAPLWAELTETNDHGFTVHHSMTTDADAFVVYRTMTSHIDQWWNGDHSSSGDAANLYMKVEQGGCFCEQLAGRLNWD